VFPLAWFHDAAQTCLGKLDAIKFYILQ
jgi:hypothetical protein